MKELLNREYPMIIFPITEKDGTKYYFAYNPDFGHSAYSVAGDTRTEAMDELDVVRGYVIQYYLDTGRPVPEPGKPPYES
ncbi:MAG: hypothetical protein GY847_28965 [Proteobacteria bacterium]|nr:hypothetical protein [Pseudomonadota bacterium]